MLNRCAPVQSLESRKVSIGGDPLTTGFDGERRKPCILDQISHGPGGSAKGAKDVPVARPGLKNLAIWLIEQQRCKRQGLCQSAWLLKDARMGGDSDEVRKHLRRHPVCRVTINHCLEPHSICLMVRRVCSKMRRAKHGHPAESPPLFHKVDKGGAIIQIDSREHSAAGSRNR